ncbi:MAG: hypothetical protein KGL53_04305, partial [Elusimicrobia bacterium]|nr:hypothetical protein [Elusimicrobiota bacterium]
MKFWVFSDARILGPFSREELAGMESVHSGTLVCKEGATGVADGDWQALEAVPELAGLALAAAPAGGYASSALFEGAGVGGGASASWPPAMEDDPRFNFWMREEYDAGRSVELERALAEMREQMARHERRQDEILDRLNQKDSMLVEREREIKELRARIMELQSGAAQAVPAPSPVLRARPVPAPEAKPAAPAAQEP